MKRRIAKVMFGVLVALAAFGAAFTVAMRTKFPPFQNALRRFNRTVVNPDQMKTAGRPGAYASVIRHVGRTSGKDYETPVQARATDDGFVIPLPYGTTPDWYKNVVAAGSATLVNEGGTFQVDHPELVSTALAEPYILPDDLKTQRWLGIDEYLQLRTVVPAEKRADVTEPV